MKIVIPAFRIYELEVAHPSCAGWAATADGDKKRREENKERAIQESESYLGWPPIARGRSWWAVAITDKNIYSGPCGHLPPSAGVMYHDVILALSIFVAQYNSSNTFIEPTRTSTEL